MRWVKNLCPLYHESPRMQNWWFCLRKRLECRLVPVHLLHRIAGYWTAGFAGYPLGIFIIDNREEKRKCYFKGQIPSNNSAQSGGFI